MAKKRADGRYSVQFRVDGKRFTVYGTTMKEAREKEAKKRLEITEGLKPSKYMTVEKWFETWMDGRTKLTDSSRRTNEKHMKRFCRQKIGSREFGEIKLEKLETKHIRKLQQALAEQFKTRTVNDTISFLKQGLRAAVNERVINWNPCDAVETLTRTEEEARNNIHRCLSKEEVNAFLEGAEYSHYYNLYKVMLFTGMRVGEATAFYPEDVKNGILSVNKTVTRESIGYLVREQTKTEAGRRTIPLMKDARDAINNELAKTVIRMGKPVFTMKNGGVVRPDRVNEDIDRICKRVGIEKFTNHAFRATFISRCVEDGMPVKELMEICGHKDVQMCLGLYAHSNDKNRQQELEKVAII